MNGWHLFGGVAGILGAVGSIAWYLMRLEWMYVALNPAQARTVAQWLRSAAGGK